MRSGWGDQYFGAPIVFLGTGFPSFFACLFWLAKLFSSVMIVIRSFSWFSSPPLSGFKVFCVQINIFCFLYLSPTSCPIFSSSQNKNSYVKKYLKTQSVRGLKKKRKASFNNNNQLLKYNLIVFTIILHENIDWGRFKGRIVILPRKISFHQRPINK